MTHITPFLMFDDGVEQAVEFYIRTFRDSHLVSMSRVGEDGPVISAEFIVGGQCVLAYNGGPTFSFAEGFSMYVDCTDQAEVDRYWDALVTQGARPSQCGWITDPWGVTWQIIPQRFRELMADPDASKRDAVLHAMFQMVKFDVDALERAYAEA